ncbi:MAG TPA: sodium-dependent transporter [Ruminococcus sp.]|nr:sodium-dependent transporter [Ruminococcus sp.]
MSSDTKTENSRGGFGSKIGFILAAAGSAVGLGNIWRFPYLAARYGGGIFLLIYLILAITFGFTMMLTEIALGRKTGKSVLGAYKEADKRFAPLGWLAAVVPAIILPYYCVIGGWVLKYMCMFITGDGGEAANSQFAADSGSSLTFFEHYISLLGQPTLFFVLYVLIGSVAVLLGVEKGIEKVSKILMPVLLVLIIIIAGYTLTMDGAMDGLKYYVLPDFTDFTVTKLLKTIAAAVGQLFYSMSLAMGIMVTYGSYMRKSDSLEGSVRQIEVFDTAVAFLAGMVIVPSVFVFSKGDPTALNAGPGLMFITLPKVFDSMPGGQIIGAAFFLLVSLAALTSSISLMETVVAAVMEKTKMSRSVSYFAVIAFTIIVGMLSVMGYSVWSDFELMGMQILDFFDFISNNIFMPILAFFTCILFGYVIKTKYVEDEVQVNGDKFRSVHLYRIMIKVFCPICMIIILLTPFVTDI